MSFRRLLARWLLSEDRRRRLAIVEAAKVQLPPTDFWHSFATFQRTGVTNPLGSYDDELPKIRINSETLARARMLAAQEGLSVSEWIRLHVETRVWGVETLANMHAERVRRVGGNGVQA